jgi:hypothetical protein
MPIYTVQCGYAAYWANTQIVEAESPEEACEKAIEAANGDPVWRSVDDVGDTFVDAIREGEGDPWDGPCAVPERFSERALHAPTPGTPAVLVDVRGGNVEQVTACGDVRVMVLDHDNPSFNEDAVDDRVDAAIMKRLARCSREAVEAHERELDQLPEAERRAGR